MGLSPPDAMLTHSKSGVSLDDGALLFKVRR